MSIEKDSRLNEFRRVLKIQEKPFLLHTILPSDKVYIEFEGVLDNEPVVWHACIRTMQEYASHHTTPADPMQFINIEVLNGVHKLEVGLNISQIDQSAVERTIIMVRKYKRLRLGRHEYGARSKTE